MSDSIAPPAEAAVSIFIALLRAINARGTARNWNTVLKLLALASG